jgi:uncharacterized protein (DUF433 family)
MIQATTVDIGTLITATPGVYGGRPCLAGTRYPVREVALHFNAGVSPEEIAQDFELALEKVYAAVAYYLANKNAIDTDLHESQVAWERGKRGQEKARTSRP